jgi:hypothetical protein
MRLFSNCFDDEALDWARGQRRVSGSADRGPGFSRQTCAMIWMGFHIFVITRPLLSIGKEEALKKFKS